ncbi:SRPBCC family protein [Phaeobacter inhibens]|uniref:SRPBCC family protein n=1 Tax=Phaeobacter inhibens TaxID=221822 RepID=UPI0021A55976|nr:SRPBCC domain-containing protein [Phaeobacter inhibens]
MTDTILRKSIYLRAAPAQVWAYLTEPEKLEIWFHKPKTPLVEGPYEMFGTESGKRLMWGEVHLAEPYTRLEYSFTIAPMGDQTSTVSWTLTEVPGGHQPVADPHWPAAGGGSLRSVAGIGQGMGRTSGPHADLRPRGLTRGETYGDLPRRAARRRRGWISRSP